MPTKSDDKTTAAVRPAYEHIGIDAEGRHHVAHWPSSTMHIIDPATGDRRRFPIPTDCHVELEYVAEVRKRIGWSQLDYGAEAHDVAEVRC